MWGGRRDALGHRQGRHTGAARRWLGAIMLLAMVLPPSLPAAAQGTAGSQGGQEFTREVLPNGLVVLVEERPGSGLVAVEVAVLAGARYEGADTGSAAQFLEQLLQDGTPSRPTRRDVLRAITARGGDLTIDATWERVRVAAEMASEDFDLAVDVLSDIVLRSLFAPNRMEAARERILQNLDEREDTPSDYVNDVALANALGDPAMRHLPVGSAAGVRALTRDALLRYRDTHFTAGNTIVAVAGDVRRADVLPRIAAAFAELPPGPRQRPLALPAAQVQPRVERDAGSEQSNIAVAVRTPSTQAADRAALVVLSGILGGGAQRLYTEIRDQRGLAYSVGASILQMTDAGVLLTMAGTEPPNTAEVTSLLLGELARLRETPASEAEVARSIAYFVDGQIVSLETVGARANDLTSREVLYGVAPPREQFRQQLRAVRAADVQAAAQRYLAPENLLTVVLRPQ